MDKRIVAFQDLNKKVVATITETSDGLFFEYDKNWKGLELDPSLPLGFKGILNEWQVE